MKNKYILVSIVYLGLLNISTILASDNTAKQSKFLARPAHHRVKIKIEIEHKSQSLESYFRRTEKLEEIAISCDSSKKVNVDQNAWTIYMTVKQKRLNKKQARIEAQNLVDKINQEMVLPKIEVVSVKRKKCL